MKISTITVVLILMCVGCLPGKDESSALSVLGTSDSHSENVKVACSTSSESGQACCFSNVVWNSQASLCGELVVTGQLWGRVLGRITLCSGTLDGHTSVTVHTGMYFEECYRCQPERNNCCTYDFTPIKD